MSERIEVVLASEDLAGPGKPFGDQRIFEVSPTRVGFTRLGPGATTPWHHHGACNFFGFVVRGEVRLEFGPGGRDAVRVSDGQFLWIPPRLVHRDINESEGTVLIATVCVGEEPSSVQVEGPDGEGDLVGHRSRTEVADGDPP